MTRESAFDEAVKGVDTIVCTASVMSFSLNPYEVIQATIAGATGTLKSVAREQRIRHFVYTSSSTAATIPKPRKKFKIDRNTQDDEAVRDAWAPPPYNADRAFTVYAARKTEAERAVWKFVEEWKPHFVVDCVNPNASLDLGYVARPEIPRTATFHAKFGPSVLDVTVDILLVNIREIRHHVSQATAPEGNSTRRMAKS
jgi:nucleoside-diphosphate-sugar epimerase